MAQIAAVMIARDEQRCITRALDSIRPFVDEMIVLDTGSTDDTISCAQKSGATVFSFAWCDDFSKARNMALDHSTARWNLIIDADEYLVTGGNILKAAASTDPCYVGAVTIESAYTHNETDYHVRNWLTRLLPSTVRYAGRVHEQPIHHLPTKQLAIEFGHDGYLPQQHKNKRGRNEFLLNAELGQSPNDVYLHYQLGKEKEIDNHFDAAVSCYQNALDILDSSFASWHHDLVVRMLFCLKKIKAYQAAVDLAGAWEAKLYDVPDYHFVLGDIYLDVALMQPEQADAFLPLIEAHWLRCLDIGERPDLDGCVTGRGSILAEHNLHIFYESLGLNDKAILFKKL